MIGLLVRPEPPRYLWSLNGLQPLVVTFICPGPPAELMTGEGAVAIPGTVAASAGPGATPFLPKPERPWLSRVSQTASAVRVTG